MIWNVGIGPTASFVPTLSRLFFHSTKELYGPYEHIIHVRLPIPSTTDASSTISQHRLVFDVLAELATTLLGIPLPEDIMQLAAEESYFGYCKISDYLMLQAFGQMHIKWFPSDKSIMWDPVFERQPLHSPILERIKDKLGMRHLLLVENLHVPVSLDMLVLTMGELRPSVIQKRRWLISTTSRDVCQKCRSIRGLDAVSFLTPEYYYAPPFHDLRRRDWAVLIKEALRDAAGSIHSTLKEKGNEEFWLRVAQHCLYYGILYHPLQGRQKRNISSVFDRKWNTCSVTSDELVRFCVAEDLIFSTAIGKKQRNYYRSAYEAGRVVIQALQEYSLLPIYSVSTPGVSPSSSEGVITGVSKLAEGASRLREDELSTHGNSNQLRWVSFFSDHGRHVSWDWWPRETRGDTMMTSLSLRGCSNVSAFPLDILLTPHLRVLDLSHTPINSLPPSFCRLLNLCMLSLRSCTKLKRTFSPPPSTSDKEISPLAYLEKLQVLDMNGFPLLQLRQQDGCNKSNLHYLDLSGSMFTTLPSEFFCEMSSLQELILGDCTNLKELPPSIAQLSNLLVLHVEGTQVISFPEHMFQKMHSLHTLKLINNVLLLSLPMSMSEAKALKELHISMCISLRLQSLWELLLLVENLYIQTWEGLENIMILGHPNLRTFSLSGPCVRFLSLSGCSKLKSVNFSDDLTALEVVDLSRTAIEEVPHNLPNLPQLNKLLLVGVACFKRFPWHRLFRIPKVFYLVHCANDDSQIQHMFGQQKTCGDEKQEDEKTTNTAHVKINDPRMFHSFNEDAAKNLVKEAEFLQSFNVQVKPSIVTGKKPRNSEAVLFTRIQRHSTYRDIQFSVVDSIMPMMELQPMQRHVEISAVNQFPNGLRNILAVTKSILITDDKFIRCLTDLNYSLNELEECQLQHCHQMTVIFLIHSGGSHALPNLQTLQIFDLNNLLSVVEPGNLRYSRFIALKLLKHIHLEHCPRLQKMFPCSLSLPALETLVILFCSNLKTIFYKHPQYSVAPSPLPNIKRIYLQELPQLQHIHDVIKFEFEAPNWENLFVRGCQSFQGLPLLKMEYPKLKVEVSGEREWWDRLQLKLPEQSDYYLHVAPPKFVSRKNHIIKSYLR